MVHHLDHFTHGHTLREDFCFENEEFMCGGCNTFGSGVRYECSEKYCIFNLHKECGTSPTFLQTHIHPMHQLELNWREERKPAPPPPGMVLLLPYCDVCGEQVKGLYYRCPSCDYFYLHPVCAKFPERLTHLIDKKHDLTFQSASVPSFCSICHASCSSWRYRCGPCGFDIHPECVTTPFSSSKSPQPPYGLFRSASTPTMILQQQHHHQQKSPPPPPTTINFSGDYNYTIGGVPAAASPPYPYCSSSPPSPYPYWSSPPSPYPYWSSPLSPYGATYQHHHNHHHYHIHQGNDAATTSSSSSSGTKRRIIYAVVGKILTTLALGAVFGTPLLI